MEENTTQVIFPEEPQIPDPIPSQPPPDPVPQQFPEMPAEQKPRKKPGKKLLLAGIALVLVLGIVLAAVLIPMGSRGPKNTCFFIRDDELWLYAQGMKEPVELSSSLWKNGQDNSSPFVMGFDFSSLVHFRNGGKLVIYPDKYRGKVFIYPDMYPDMYPNKYIDYQGVTMYVTDLSKKDPSSERIGRNIFWSYVTEDGTQMLAVVRSDGDYSLYLYNLETGEKVRVAQDILWTDFLSRIAYTPDLSRIYYIEDGDAYLWTPEDEDDRIARGDISRLYYFPETDLLFLTAENGDLLLKTADMDDAEVIAEDVYSLLACYPTGEAYYLCSGDAEYFLADYLEDDLKEEDAALTPPERPNYPSAPARVYSWNFATEEEYLAAQEQYDADYAAYLEEYSAMKEEYDAALEHYAQKEARDELRAGLVDSRVLYGRSTLCFFDATQEHILTEDLDYSWLHEPPRAAAVSVYSAYLPREAVKPKMSELDNLGLRSVEILLEDTMVQAQYGESAFYLAVGSSVFPLEDIDPARLDFRMGTYFYSPSDGTAVYYLDAPFSAADVSGAEAPAVSDSDCSLDSAERQNYATLYRIPIADGQPGNPEPVESDVCVYDGAFNPDHLLWFRNTDPYELCGELCVGGQTVHGDAYLKGYQFLGDRVVFFTDWDEEDQCGTLCVWDPAVENAGPVEIAEDVRAFTVTEAGDLFFLSDYSTKRQEGTLFLYDMDKGKTTEIADDVYCILD